MLRYFHGVLLRCSLSGCTPWSPGVAARKSGVRHKGKNIFKLFTLCDETSVLVMITPV